VLSSATGKRSRKAKLSQEGREAIPSSPPRSNKSTPEGQPPVKRRPKDDRMEVDTEAAVRQLSLDDSALMPPPPPPPYTKSSDPSLNPLAVNTRLCTRPASSSSQPTPTKGASSHITDLAKEYAAAAAAASTTTPQTDENRRIVTSNDPVVREHVALQKLSLKPKGRVQRLLSMAPTPEETRNHRTAKRREQRARAAALQTHHEKLMRRLHDVGQFSETGLELWELLMIEFALQPSSAGLSSGQMRMRYQEQLYAARLREFVPRQHGVGALPELRQLLLKYPDARALAMARLRHAKYFTPHGRAPWRQAP